MPEPQDFERQWLEKLSRCLTERAGEQVRDRVMAGSEALSDRSSRAEVIAWTQQAMQRLEAAVDGGTAQEIMNGCACQYPAPNLHEARETYAGTGDIDRVHRMLQEQFESLLFDVLKLDPADAETVLSRGWGLAGVRDGTRIIATKIPKSGYLVEYLHESDPERRRQIYCHCPRIRDAVQQGEAISATYCACGAGYYRGIWEEILQQPVRVEVLESVLDGGEVCTVAIHLPEGA
jgi:hypothetical protein